MELQKTKHQLKLEEWKGRVHECRNSGMTVKAWCAEQGIKEQTYYRWQKQVWEAGTSKELACVPPQAVSFAEYQPLAFASKSLGSVVVHLDCGSVEIQNGATQKTIAATLQALKSLC